LDLIYVILESVYFSGSTEGQLGVFQLEDQLMVFFVFEIWNEEDFVPLACLSNWPVEK